jgi:dTDP-4-amino-4,6-dideoxygalactose transaminase
VYEHKNSGRIHAPGPTTIPLLDLGLHLQPIQQQIRIAIDEVIASHQFIGGPSVTRFEADLARYCGADFAYGVSSGTDALLVALMALEVGPGDEVITSPYTFFATAGAVARLRAKPVFVDIDPDTYNMDPGKVEPAITPRTRGLIAVHLFGHLAGVETLLDCVRDRELFLVEDAAQAIGAEIGGVKAGCLGQIGCFSFFPSKNLGCFGDGGAVTTGDAPLASKLDILRNHGARPKYHHALIGGNFRLDTIQAAVLRVELPHLDSWTEQRRLNAARYRRLFDQAELTLLPDGGGGAPALEDMPVVLPLESPNCKHIYNQFVIRVRERDDLLRHLKNAGVGCEVYYPLPLHLQQCFAYLGYKPGDLPQAELAAQQTLAIPIYPELSDEQAERVVGVMADFYQRRRT